MSRNEHKFENSDCQTVADLNIAGFFLDKPCTVSLVCDPVYFTVTMDNSLVKCSGRLKMEQREILNQNGNEDRSFYLQSFNLIKISYFTQQKLISFQTMNAVIQTK